MFLGSWTLNSFPGAVMNKNLVTTRTLDFLALPRRPYLVPFYLPETSHICLNSCGRHSMYYRQRKMEAENQVFIYRMGQLPMVKAACERAISMYGATKNYNNFLNTTLQMAENSVKYASETEAVKKALHNPLVSVANNIAVGQLDKLEENYPAIKKTPDEVWDAGKGYYESSRIKGGVDKLYSAKDYSVAKIDDTRKYYQSVVSGELPPFQVFSDMTRCSMLILNGLLDYSDAFIDKYVAVNSEEPCPSGSEDVILVNRVQSMSGKVYNGLKYRASTKYGETKGYIVQTLSDLQTAMALMEYAKNTTSWLNERTVSTLTTAQEQARNLWGEIQRRAEPVGKQSEIVLLNLVQGLASSMASLSNQIVKYSTPYLPEYAGKNVSAAANYAQELRDVFAKAQNLTDLRDEVIAEARDKIGSMQDGLLDAIDYFAEFPPVCWLALDMNGMEFDEEELIHMDRDTRRPGQPRFVLPVIEPRQNNEFHCG